MKNKLFTLIMSLALVFLTLFFILNYPVISKADDKAAYMNTGYVRMRSGPGTGYDILVDGLPDGANITVTGEERDQSGALWYKISYGDITGYVYAEYVSFYADTPTDDAFEKEISVFPESYRQGLRLIHSIYPNYKFEADIIGDSFNSCVDCEYPYKVMYFDSTDYSWLSLEDGTYNWTYNSWNVPSSGWTSVSWEVAAYYMDPRNFFNAKDIYMFLTQKYSADQTADKIRDILKGTFMENSYTPKKGHANDEKYKGDYAQVILAAAKESGVSAYFIATNILGEQGTTGSVLTSGKYPGYEGYYNFYNYDVYGTTEAQALLRGMQRAKAEGWDNIYDCIVNGAKIYARDFLNNRQDTFFYKDYNLLNGQHNGMYYNQYAGAVAGPKILANRLSNYLGSDSSLTLTFRIPVYSQMSDAINVLPPGNDKLNNYYFTDISGDLSPAFDKYVHTYSMNAAGNTSIDVYVPGNATYTGRSQYSLGYGNNNIVLSVTSETGFSRSYTITVNAASSCTLTVNVKSTEFAKINDNGSNGSGGSGQGSSSSGGGTTPGVASDPVFPDVTDTSASYYRPIYWAAAHDYIRGYKNGYFGPSDDCTRGQFVTILWRMAGRPNPETSVNPFSDVKSSDSYYHAILWAAENDIIRGYSDGTFRPSQNISRLNVVVMLWRMSGRPEADMTASKFPDVDSSITGYKAVYWGENSGVVRGSNGYFNPYNNCTRSQIVTFFYRYARDVQGQDVSFN